LSESQVIPFTYDHICRPAEAAHVIGVGKTAFYEVEKNDDFPRAIQVTGTVRGWLHSELITWLKSRRSN